MFTVTTKAEYSAAFYSFISVSYLSMISGLIAICSELAFNTLSSATTINATEERGKMITPSPVVSVTVCDRERISLRCCPYLL